MHTSRSLSRLAALVLLAACAEAPSPDAPPSVPPPDEAAAVERPDLGRFFGDVEGTFVLLDGRTGRTVRTDAERARTRFLPASTFKIPNTLIALETGVATGPDFPLAWDSAAVPRQDFWPEAWAGDHTLRTALPASVVWYYQELARRIGPERMQEYLDRFDYGNRDISGGIDRFWLSGGLAVSPDEQVDFLRRFHDGELGVSGSSTALVKELLLLEETPAYRLSGKTGYADFDDGRPGVGWLVGWIERGDGVHFFATNIDVREDADLPARMAVTRAILGELGLLE